MLWLLAMISTELVALQTQLVLGHLAIRVLLSPDFHHQSLGLPLRRPFRHPPALPLVHLEVEGTQAHRVDSQILQALLVEVLHLAREAGVVVQMLHQDFCQHRREIKMLFE